MEIPESTFYQMNCPPADRGHHQQISPSRDHQPSVARQQFPGTSPPGVLPDSNRPLPPVSRAELDLPEDTQRHLATLSTLYINMVWRDQDGKYTGEICDRFKQIQQSCEDFDRSLWCKDERERKTAAERLVKTGIIDLLCDVMVKGLESGDKNNPPSDHDSSPLLISTQILTAVFSHGGVLLVPDVKYSAVFCRLGADARLLPVLLTKVKEWYRPHMDKLLTAPQDELLRRCLTIILNIALCDNKGRERLRQLGATVVLTHCLKSAVWNIVLLAVRTLAKIVTEEDADRLTAADFVTAFCDAARTHGFAGFCLADHRVMGRVAVRGGAVTELIQRVQQTDDEGKKCNCLSTLGGLCKKQQHIPPSVKQELLDFAAAEYRNDTRRCRHWAKAILAELRHDLERASRHRQLCLELGYSPVDSPDGETGASERKRKIAESSLDHNQVFGNTGDSMNGFHSGPSTTQPLSVKRKAVMRMAQNKLSVTTPHAMQRPSTSTYDVTLTQHYLTSSASTVLLWADQHQPMNTTAAQHEDFSLLQSQNPASLSIPWHVDQGILLQSTRPVSSGLPLSQPVSSGLPLSLPVSSGFPVSQPPEDSQPLGPQYGIYTYQSVVQVPPAMSVGFPTSSSLQLSAQQHSTFSQSPHTHLSAQVSPATQIAASPSSGTLQLIASPYFDKYLSGGSTEFFSLPSLSESDGALDCHGADEDDNMDTQSLEQAKGGNPEARVGNFEKGSGRSKRKQSDLTVTEVIAGLSVKGDDDPRDGHLPKAGVFTQATAKKYGLKVCSVTKKRLQDRLKACQQKNRIQERKLRTRDTTIRQLRRELARLKGDQSSSRRPVKASAGCSGRDLPKAGVYTPEDGKKHGMVQLVSGHAVYLYPSQLRTALNESKIKPDAESGTSRSKYENAQMARDNKFVDGPKLARRLLQVFFTVEERKVGSLAEKPRTDTKSKQTLVRLNETITDAILACCRARDVTTTRAKVWGAMGSALSELRARKT